MCVSSEEEAGGSGTTGTYSYSNGVEEIVVTAPRISLNQDMLANIDWAEVGRLTSISGITAGLAQGVYGALIGTVGGGLLAIEAQPDVDLTGLIETVNDIPLISGYPAPYLPLY
jgi:hypothetical protein